MNVHAIIRRYALIWICQIAMRFPPTAGAQRHKQTQEINPEPLVEHGINDDVKANPIHVAQDVIDRHDYFDRVLCTRLTVIQHNVDLHKVWHHCRYHEIGSQAKDNTGWVSAACLNSANSKQRLLPFTDENNFSRCHRAAYDNDPVQRNCYRKKRIINP